MDRRQKSALRSQHIKIADELILDEDFYAALRRDKIFTNSMLDIIKAEAKPRDRVYKMLELLEKRGPNAFANFVLILKENYEWLADVLDEEYQRRLANQQGQSLKRPMQQKYMTYQESVLHRSTSTPNPGSRVRECPPNQGPASSSVYDKCTQHFFAEASASNKQNQDKSNSDEDVLDCAENLTIQIPSSTDVKDESCQAKTYKDACISPIGVIESPRKKVTAMCSPIRNVTFAVSDDDSFEENFDEIQTQTSENVTDALEVPFRNISQCEGLEIENKDDDNDTVDGFENVEFEFNEDASELISAEDLMPGEEYYELVRNGSSCIPNFGDEMHDSLLTTPGCESQRFDPREIIYTPENDITRSDMECEHHEALGQLIDKIRTLYIKISSVNSDKKPSTVSDEGDESEDNNITWMMLEEEVDKLINRLENSDDMKMIQKCQELFPEKDRRYPLNICIEKLSTDKSSVESRLSDKKKEMDQMVFDLWKHQQDMSNIRKLKQANDEMNNEIDNLKASLANMEKDGDQKLKLLELKDNKIKELESKVKELEEERLKRHGPPRRGHGQLQRRTSNTQGQSPRRMNTSSNFPAEPRTAVFQATIGTPQQSPRNITSAINFRRAGATKR